MYFIFVSLFLFLSFFSCNTSLEMSSRKTSKNNTKLVVGVVVDQMRFEYLNRFKNKYTSQGFLKLINQGYSCNNHHFNYIPTITGPGHASIFSGTTPSVHGIIGNDWYDKVNEKTVYCTTSCKILLRHISSTFKIPQMSARPTAEKRQTAV